MATSAASRRLLPFAALACGAVVLVLVLLSSSGGEDPPSPASTARVADEPAPSPRNLPRGGRRIFPDHRVVAFYGAPQDEELGTLGIGTPDQAARRLERLSKHYSRRTRPALPALELISTIANAHPGDDGLYRRRQEAKVIGRYLRAARRAKALLLLDIQPGRGQFFPEATRLERWLREPDVGLALDPEWHVGPQQVPGKVIGSMQAREVNAISAWMDKLVKRHRLPQKLLVVHQFTENMIQGRSRLKARDGVAVTLNVDGFGDRPNKIAKYDLFTDQRPRLHDGFKLFFKEDVRRMGARQVLTLTPPPDLIVYE